MFRKNAGEEERGDASAHLLILLLLLDGQNAVREIPTKPNFRVLGIPFTARIFCFAMAVQIPSPPPPRAHPTRARPARARSSRLLLYPIWLYLYGWLGLCTLTSTPSASAFPLPADLTRPISVLRTAGSAGGLHRCSALVGFLRG